MKTYLHLVCGTLLWIAAQHLANAQVQQIDKGILNNSNLPNYGIPINGKPDLQVSNPSVGTPQPIQTYQLGNTTMRRYEMPFTAVVRNSGNAKASDCKLLACAATAPLILSVSSCAAVSSLAAGESRTVTGKCYYSRAASASNTHILINFYIDGSCSSEFPKFGVVTESNENNNYAPSSVSKLIP